LKTTLLVFKLTLLVISIFALGSCGRDTDSPTHTGVSAQPVTPVAQHTPAAVKYVKTHRGKAINTYFGTSVADPYRWLEDDRSAETAAWVVAQNQVTADYLKNIPYRSQLQERLLELWNYERESAPFREGNYSYYYRNNGLQDQYVVYRKKDAGAEEVFLDPNTFSEDGTTSLAQLSFSRDGSLAAYSISEGGSDWRKIIVIDAESRNVLETPLVDVKFSDIAWRGNEGFYYSSYDKPEGSELSAKTDQHKLYFHIVGTTQAEDELIFGGTLEQKRRYVGGHVTEDDHFLVVAGAMSTSGNDLFIQDLSKSGSPLVKVLGDFDSDTEVIANAGNTLYLVTNRGAPNRKIVRTDAQSPIEENWVDLLPETEHVLSVTTLGGYFFAEYMVDAISRVYQYDYNGKQLRELELPGKGSFNTSGGKRDDEVLFYSFTNYKLPGTLYAFEVKNGQSFLYRKSAAKFDSDAYVSEQVFYESADGTQVPMMITHKKGLKLDGSNPTLLYGYGGFNVSLTPSFSIANAVWLEQGGVYAVPNLRGGGEYGKRWHKAGTLQQKQNVFDDFIAAGEYLISKGYTSSEYLAMRGGSNGGLLVGAVMTQRPDLMRVALPAVGVLDMLRYHTFTAGAGWAYDYGTSEQSQAMFEYLKSYSPLHNLKPGIAYPATLITTADHDDRVVPAHSFKFAAQLQADQAGAAPVLIRIETKAGHGAGTPVSKLVELYADIFTFTLYNMGVSTLGKHTAMSISTETMPE
jgi:prolyl oligopeptidase